jgi:hypothetical protein
MNGATTRATGERHTFDSFWAPPLPLTLLGAFSARSRQVRRPARRGRASRRRQLTATLLVRTTRDFEYPDREDPEPTALVQYQAVCPDGSSVAWRGIVPATITSTDLKSVTASGSGTVRDIFSSDVTHEVSFDVTWTAVGPVETTVNGPGSTRKQREAVASAVVTVDGLVLVDGQALHPTRPEPFIRVDIEK